MYVLNNTWSCKSVQPTGRGGDHGFVCFALGRLAARRPRVLRDGAVSAACWVVCAVIAVHSGSAAAGTATVAVSCLGMVLLVAGLTLPWVLRYGTSGLASPYTSRPIVAC